MDWGAIGTGIGVFVMVMFYITDRIRTRQRNQKDEAERRGAMHSQIQHIEEELQHPDHGLDALNRNLSQMREHCASITSQYNERLVNLEGSRSRRKKSSPP